jgi:hypothetical protein
MLNKLITFTFACSVCVAAFGRVAPQTPLFEYAAINHPVIGKNGMVASHNALSSEIAADIMAKGGNAIDAGAALGFALAVTLPRAGNVGGGFMLIHVAKLDKTIAIDFRETAPAAAQQDMFFDKNGNVVTNETYRFSHKSSAVPGSVAGLAHIVENYGTMTLAEVLEPAMLTELFAPEIHQKRLDTWPDNYLWIDITGYQYFRKRLSEARRDVQHGLNTTLNHFKTREQQEQALDILQFKLDILWSMLDAMQLAYVYAEPPFHSCSQA